MRIALFARVPAVVVQMDALLRQLGHECVGVVTTEGPRRPAGAQRLSRQRLSTQSSVPHIGTLLCVSAVQDRL